MVALVLFHEVRKDTYYDSITLMLFSGALSAAEGVKNASVMMGTAHNKALMQKAGILSAEGAAQAGPNDMIIGILAESDEAVAGALAELDRQLSSSSADSATDESAPNRKARSLDAAIRQSGGANFAIVSVPGKYAAAEAMRAMRRGLHVLLFSDNVTIEDEIRLKDYAVEHELLLMGPDCGTAWVNGTAFGFANKVRRGGISLAAPSGTGLQEVCVIIDRLGGGIAQALGTGGRDVKEEVGGRMLLMELKALNADPMTKVIGIVSKPPADDVLRKIIELAKGFSKPVVACFLGGNRDMVRGSGIGFADTMEDCAKMLVSLCDGVDFPADDPDRYDELARAEIARYTPEQRYVRGLYSGGSLCYEGILLAEKYVGPVYSNITSGDYCLRDPEVSVENTFIDMGEDYFTDGMPHPMIDTRQRVARIKKEALDPTVAVVVLDCVLGYGSNPDPAGALAAAVEEARSLAEGRHITYIASCCGTYADFQDRAAQEEKLRRAGILVADCNAQSAKMAAAILKRLKAGR